MKNGGVAALPWGESEEWAGWEGLTLGESEEWQGGGLTLGGMVNSGWGVLPWGVGEEWRGGGSAVQLLLCLGRCGHHCWGRVLHLRLADTS